jgi:hypothetical protein
LFDGMLAQFDGRAPGSPLVDEQNTLDAIITADPALLGNIHMLSEGLFVNGLGYCNLLSEPAHAWQAGAVRVSRQLDGETREQAKTDGANRHLADRD